MRPGLDAVAQPPYLGARRFRALFAVPTESDRIETVGGLLDEQGVFTDGAEGPAAGDECLGSRITSRLGEL